MIEQLKTIRDNLGKFAAGYIDAGNKIVDALTQLEAMVGEQEPCGWYDDGRVFLHEGRLPPNGADLYAAPVAQQPQAEPFQPDWVNYRQGLHDGWAEGYEQGIADERTSEANIGIAGFGAKVKPARENPYKNTAPQQAEAVPPDVVRDAERYRWLRDYIPEPTELEFLAVGRFDDFGAVAIEAADLDDAIDAAIAQQKGQS